MQLEKYLAEIRRSVKVMQTAHAEGDSRCNVSTGQSQDSLHYVFYIHDFISVSDLDM